MCGHENRNLITLPSHEHERKQYQDATKNDQISQSIQMNEQEEIPCQQIRSINFLSRFVCRVSFVDIFKIKLTQQDKCIYCLLQ